MKLSIFGLKNKDLWQSKGYKLPNFDIEKMRENTIKAPIWLHFGAGNIFRAFPAALQQDLLDKGLSDRGIIVCESYDEEIIEKAYIPYDNLSILVTLKADGTVDKRVIGSVAHAMNLKESINKLIDIFTSPSLQMASFTITEKGYSLIDSSGNYLKEIAEDLSGNFQTPKTLMGTIAFLCYKRYLAGKFPIALVSLDNCSHNGSKLYDAVKTFADSWVKNKKVDAGF